MCRVNFDSRKPRQEQLLFLFLKIKKTSACLISCWRRGFVRFFFGSLRNATLPHSFLCVCASASSSGHGYYDLLCVLLLPPPLLFFHQPLRFVHLNACSKTKKNTPFVLPLFQRFFSFAWCWMRQRDFEYWPNALKIKKRGWNPTLAVLGRSCHVSWIIHGSLKLSHFIRSNFWMS